ncbi:mitochondrial carrier [Cystobasidium minutum MCA 4210]|uniref:mitochondrial carrier n=1 Tax=Cystobasidium minutum MCA 4210 TaxID=1397322 RepID=UPI0034CD40EC|eukprot:jgi/Rhomi1/184643/fgenesh1_pm.11_\
MDAPSVASARPAWKDLAYGSHPFDLVKVRLQSQPFDRPARFNGPIDCFKQTIQNEGFKGLYRGLSMPVIGAMLENATLFVVYGQAQNLLRRYTSPTPDLPDGRPGPLSLPKMAFAGACAGAATSLVLTPIELVKVRMQVQMIAQEQTANLSQQSTGQAIKQKLPGPVQLTRSVLQQHGFKGLWLGQTGTFIRESGGSVAWFGAFEGLARFFISQKQKSAPPGKIITKDNLSSPELMLSGAAAGAGYTVILFPADCIKSTIQTGDELAKGRKQAGFLQVGKDIYKAKGIKGLYSGCGVTIVRSAPSSALIFWLYSLCERYFG